MKRVIAVLALTLAAAGCASRQPPPELVDARATYVRAQHGPAAQVNLAGLYEARRALDVAEREQSDHPGSESARDLAYVAQRKALLAETNARTAMATAQAEQAALVVQQMQRRALAETRGELRDTQEKLGENAAALGAEAKARADAEQREQQAMQSLAAIASVKQDSAGATVITLPGNVLFETGKSELMPSARDRLGRVAEALSQASSKQVRIVGYTDSVGSPGKNRDLSQRRAESVRSFLASHGVAEDRLVAEGRGQMDPVASNASPDGRAMNRRVEIVVEGAGASE